MQQYVTLHEYGVVDLYHLNYNYQLKRNELVVQKVKRAQRFVGEVGGWVLEDVEGTPVRLGDVWKSVLGDELHALVPAEQGHGKK